MKSFRRDGDQKQRALGHFGDEVGKTGSDVTEANGCSAEGCSIA
jgi:hypothetical protein